MQLAGNAVARIEWHGMKAGTFTGNGANTGGRAIPKAGFFETLDLTFRYRDHTLRVLRRLYDRHGPVVTQSTRPLPLVSLFGPEANRFVLLDQEQQLSAKRAWDLIMGRIFSNGLLLRDGADHLHHRRIMQVAFRSPALREYVERMNPQVATILSTWDRERNEVKAFRAFKQLTLQLACSIFLGIDVGDDVQPLNEAFEATVAASMSLIRLRIPGLEFERGLRGRQYMIDFFGSLIPARRDCESADVFSRLCRAESEEGARYDDAQIVDHMIFLMMAAHDTTTSTLTSIVYELARHPEWQERVREECFACAAEFPSFDDLGKLDVTTMVMNETLRRYPPLSTIPRVSQQACSFEGYEIPANAMVAVYPLHTHHMEGWWTDPFRFDPERFSGARGEQERHTHLFVPFGGGAHMCLGYRFAELQIKIVLSHLVRRYRWHVPEGYEMPLQQAPISKPKDGLPITLERIG